MQTTSPLPITTTPRIHVTDRLFWEICQQNPELRLERTAQGELIVNPPTGGETGGSNADLIIDIGIWSRKANLGKIFDSSTGFRLPNGATRSPDVSWVLWDRWNDLQPEQRRSFIPLAPDFALELMSPSDKLSDVQDKMQEYIDNGVRLGWLINLDGKTVEIYRLGQPVQVVNIPCTLRGEDVLIGLQLQMSKSEQQH
ncbi:MAG: Uma2 family endonuclease [Microcoleaceae cyanobacterium]